VHAEDDWDIPYDHSETLFDAILEPHLPALPALPAGQGSTQTTRVLEERIDRTKERAEVRSRLVNIREVERLGRLEVFAPSGSNEVVFLKTRWGGHNSVGLLEGVQDMMRDMFNI